RGRPLRPGPDPPGPALRARGQRHRLDRRSDDHAGRARRDARSAYSRRRRRAALRAWHAAGRDPRPPRSWDAGPAGFRPRRPACARQRAGTAPADGRAADAARGTAAQAGRGALRRRRGVLREAEERVPLRSFRRVAAVVPSERAESARALMLELFPEGFEEREARDGVELAAYTDAGGEERLWAAFGAVRSETVPEDWEERWRAFHRPIRVGPLWVGPPWERPPADVNAVVIDPGRAFGTGGHPTTRLCLQLLLELEPGSLLDIGCGSGVLAIAAARPGVSPVIAIDHDSAALEAAARNARVNAAAVEVRAADAFADSLPDTDAAVANISAAFVPQLASRVRSQSLIVSGYLESERPDVTGCGANLSADGFAGLPDNVVVVARRSEETPEFVARDVGPIGCVQGESRLDRVRAFVRVQDGCSFSCAFCVIPLVRGPSRSRKADAVLREIRKRVAQGHLEVVLTGINLGCYRDREARYSLADLVRAAGAIPGLARLRLSS